MKKIRVTQWFRWSAKPTRIGYYQRNHGLPEITQIPDYWDGKNWILCGRDGKSIGPAISKCAWRGVAK